MGIFSVRKLPCVDGSLREDRLGHTAGHLKVDDVAGGLNRDVRHFTRGVNRRPNSTRTNSQMNHGLFASVHHLLDRRCSFDEGGVFLWRPCPPLSCLTWFGDSAEVHKATREIPYRYKLPAITGRSGVEEFVRIVAHPHTEATSNVRAEGFGRFPKWLDDARDQLPTIHANHVRRCGCSRPHACAASGAACSLRSTPTASFNAHQPAGSNKMRSHAPKVVQNSRLSPEGLGGVFP